MAYVDVYLDVSPAGENIEIKIFQDNEFFELEDSDNVHPTIRNLSESHDLSGHDGMVLFLDQIKNNPDSHPHVMVPRISGNKSKYVTSEHQKASAENLDQLSDFIKYKKQYNEGIKAGKAYQNSGYGLTFLNLWKNLDRSAPGVAQGIERAKKENHRNKKSWW